MSDNTLQRQDLYYHQEGNFVALSFVEWAGQTPDIEQAFRKELDEMDYASYQDLRTHQVASSNPTRSVTLHSFQDIPNHHQHRIYLWLQTELQDFFPLLLNYKVPLVPYVCAKKRFIRPSPLALVANRQKRPFRIQRLLVPPQAPIHSFCTSQKARMYRTNPVSKHSVISIGDQGLNASNFQTLIGHYILTMYDSFLKIC